MKAKRRSIRLAPPRLRKVLMIKFQRLLANSSIQQPDETPITPVTPYYAFPLPIRNIPNRSLRRSTHHHVNRQRIPGHFWIPLAPFFQATPRL
jgi:hypothetical protein